MEKDLYQDFGGKIFQCECGKKFIPGGEWVYKIPSSKDSRTRYYCSYTCWRKAGGGNGKDTRYVSRGVN